MKTIIALFFAIGTLLAISSCVKTRTANIADYNKLFGSGITDSIKDVVINEFCARAATLPDSEDEGGTDPHWIELYNGSPNAVDFSTEQYFLTDDSTNPTKYQLSTLVMQPGTFTVVLTDDSNYVGKQIHTNFKLSKEGGFVGLYNSKGQRINSYVYDTVVNQNQSVGLLPDDGHNWVNFPVPTPGAPNHL